MSVDTRIRWLKLAAAITVAVGLLIAVAAVPALAAPTEMLVKLVVPGAEAVHPLGTPTARTLAAISGGVLVGWAVLLWMIADSLFATPPASREPFRRCQHRLLVPRRQRDVGRRRRLAECAPEL